MLLINGSRDNNSLVQLVQKNKERPVKYRMLASTCVITGKQQTCSVTQLANVIKGYITKTLQSAKMKTKDDES